MPTSRKIGVRVQGLTSKIWNLLVSISIVILVGIITKFSVVGTVNTGGGDIVCVGSGEAYDRSTLASAIVTNFLLLSGYSSVAET